METIWQRLSSSSLLFTLTIWPSLRAGILSYDGNTPESPGHSTGIWWRPRKGSLMSSPSPHRPHRQYWRWPEQQNDNAEIRDTFRTNIHKHNVMFMFLCIGNVISLVRGKKDLYAHLYPYSVKIILHPVPHPFILISVSVVIGGKGWPSWL